MDIVNSLNICCLLGVDKETKLYQIFLFFIHDSVKIFIMLFVAISILGFLRSYVSDKLIDKYLSSKGLKSYFFASLFGAVTPFCSCSSIPLFIGFIKAKIPLGIAFAFLITSPLVNEYLAILMLNFFGYKITLLYIVNGILLGVICGKLIDKMNLTHYVVDDFQYQSFEHCCNPVFNTFYSRVRYGFSESIEIIKRLWLWIVFSVFIAAVMNVYLPREKVESIVSSVGYLQVPIATLIGIPLYSSCATILPVAYVLFTKGLPLGTALSFMMATSALSLPEAILLGRVLKTKLILLFFSFVFVGIVFLGYIFNLIAKIL